MKSVAIIGCGRTTQQQLAEKKDLTGHKVGWGIAHAHAGGYREAFPDAALYAVDVNPENLAAFAAVHGISREHCFTSAEALYERIVPDAISVCTWPGLHVPQARQALERGVRAITCEKPLGLDGFSIRLLLDTLGKHDAARVAVAHQRRYEASFVEARRIIEQGVLGEQLVIEGRVGDDWDILSWTVHWFDMANFLFGDIKPRSVLAGVDHQQNDRRYGHAVERASTVLVEYDEDTRRQAMFVTGPATVPFGGITVRGERGMLAVGAGLLRLWTTDGYREISPPPQPRGPFAGMLEDLWNSANGGPISRCDISKTAVATETAYAAHESARTQRRVTLPLKTWYAPLEVLQHPPALPAKPSHRIVLLADAHHDWPGLQMGGRDGLTDALRALGHTVHLVDVSQREPTSEELANADVLAIYHTQRPIPPTTRQILGDWFAAQRPVLVSHCGIGAYADWPEFRKWIGRYWVWHGENLPPSTHPFTECTIQVNDVAAFDVPWTQGWLPIDEVYRGLGEAAPTRVLATARTDEFEIPFAWQTIDHPNVVTWLPGHRRDMFELPIVRDGLAAALRLAVKSSAYEGKR